MPLLAVDVGGHGGHLGYSCASVCSVKSPMQGFCCSSRRGGMKNFGDTGDSLVAALHVPSTKTLRQYPRQILALAVTAGLRSQ